MYSARIGVYVKTTGKNYAINLSASLILISLYGFFLKGIGWGNHYIQGFLFVSFFTVFRIIEYTLTKRTVTLYLYGREISGKDAQLNLILNILLLSFILMLSIFKTPVP